MNNEKADAGSRERDPAGAPDERILTPAAQRALAEAAERRKAAADRALAEEQGGPAGVEPTRFGDWERKGIAVDF
jgi:hypothetical protein